MAMKYVPITADGRLGGLDGVVLNPNYYWFVVLKVLYQRNGLAPPAISALPAARAQNQAAATSRPRPALITASANPGSRSSASR